MSYSETLTITLPATLADIAASIGRAKKPSGLVGTKGHAGPKPNGPREITFEMVSAVFSYNAESGEVTRKITLGGIKPSTITQADRRGYLKTSYMGIQLRCHRLAWMLHYGEFPDEGLEIDHINGDRTDNRIVNLRAVTKSINQHNIKAPRKQNKLGFLGVSKANSKYQAEIVLPGGVRKYLGVFETPEIAHQEYVKAKHAFYPGVASL